MSRQSRFSFDKSDNDVKRGLCIDILLFTLRTRKKRGKNQIGDPLKAVRPTIASYGVKITQDSNAGVIVASGDGLTNSKDLQVTNGPEVRKTECCGKNLKKKTLTL